MSHIRYCYIVSLLKVEAGYYGCYSPLQFSCQYSAKIYGFQQNHVLCVKHVTAEECPRPALRVDKQLSCKNLHTRYCPDDQSFF